MTRLQSHIPLKIKIEAHAKLYHVYYFVLTFKEIMNRIDTFCA